jgi:hypothetical protein
MQERAGSFKESPEGPRADPAARAARGILILAFALGAVGAGVAAPGHGSGDQASGYQPESSLHLNPGTGQISPDPAIALPWMY